MEPYTLGLFANMYPAFEGDYRGIFIRQMVRDLESRGVVVKKAVKTSPSVMGYFPFLWQSFLLARDGAPDILQAEYIPHSSIVPALVKRQDVPLVLKFHGDDARIFPYRNPIFRAVTRGMIRRADHILTASEDIRSILIGLGALPEQTTALHTGADTTFFRPGPKGPVRENLGVPESADVFLFVGRLTAWKGIVELLATARACPGAIFVFVGPGPIPRHPDNCRFTGALPPESVRDWYQAADCLLLPTYTEAVPTSVIEAFSCGIPAVVTNIGGCPEIVEDRRNGLIIPVRDVPALTAAVTWMQEHPVERREMGAAGRATVLERYDQRLSTGKLMEIHRSLITRS